MQSSVARCFFAAVALVLVAGALVQFTPARGPRVARSLPAKAHVPEPRAPRQEYARLPLQFEANAGQSDPRVQFLSRGAGYALDDRFAKAD